MINDYKLTLRKEKFLAHISNKITLTSTNDFQLSLRKNKLFAHIMSKRLNSFSKDRPIAFEEIQSSKDTHTQITMLQDYLYNNNYAQYSQAELDYIEETLIPKFTKCLCDSNTSIQLKETIVLIYIDLFNSDIDYFNDIMFLCEIEKELLSIAENTNAQYRKLNNLLIAFISNILADNAECHLSTTNTIDVQNIIKTAYLNGKDNEESRKIVLILIMNFIIYYDDEEKGKFIHLVNQIILPEIKLAYKLNQYKIFEQGINSLIAFAGCNNIIDLVISDWDVLNIIKEALFSYDNKTKIIEILCWLLSGSEKQIMQIITEQLIKSITDIIISYGNELINKELNYENKKLLYGKKGQSLIYAIRSLSEIICKVDSSKYSNLILIEEGLVIKSLINCLKSSGNESIQIEVINFFIKAISSNNKGILNSFMVINKIHIEIGSFLNDMRIMNHIEHNTKERLMVKILQLIETVLICSSNHDFYACIKDELHKISFVDLLIQIQLESHIDSIRSMIEDIISIHWNENEVYYSVSNEYLNVR